MAIVSGLANSFKLECLQGIHVFGTDTFRLALYTSAANLSKATTAYSTTNEITGTGYTAGGNVAAVTASWPQLNGDIAEVEFDLVAWANASFTCRGALLYNASKANRAVGVLNFGNDVGASGSTFQVNLNDADTLVEIA